MGLQWCTSRRSTCSYSRVCHIQFLDLDDCPLLGLFGLTGCVSNRHSADDCENADTQTELHILLLRQYKAIHLPRVAQSKVLRWNRIVLSRLRDLSPARHPDNIRTRGRSKRDA